MLIATGLFMLWFSFNIVSWIPHWLIRHREFTAKTVISLHKIMRRYRYSFLFANIFIAFCFWWILPTSKGPITIALMSYFFAQSKTYFRRKLKSDYRHTMYIVFLLISIAQLRDMSDTQFWLMILYLIISFFTLGICIKFFLEKIGKTRNVSFWFWELAIILSMFIINFALIYNFGYINQIHFLSEFGVPIVPHQLANAKIHATSLQLNWVDILYYSITTLTTTGYGDIAPYTRVARCCACMEMICGYFFTSILVAIFVSVLTNNKTSQGHSRVKEAVEDISDDDEFIDDDVDVEERNDDDMPKKAEEKI